MRLEWIEDILAVLDTGSFTAAADRRFLTPSAFTRRIRAMEEALGAELFDRTRKPVTLRPHVSGMEGELRDTVRRLRELKVGLSDTDGHNRQRLSVCCQHALTTAVAPWLARQMAGAPEAGLRIRSGTRSECHLMLLRQEADLGLIYETAGDALEFDSALFEKLPLGSDAFVPVAAPDFRHAPELPLITYPAGIYLGEVLRLHILPNLPRGLAPLSVAETGLSPAVLQFIRQGLGMGWLPRSVAAEALARGELAPLADRLPSTVLHVRLVRARGDTSALASRAWSRLVLGAAEIDVAGIARPG